MKRPPLKKVAAIAGVSEPTVSRVLNGKPGVADATRSRVVDTLQELGFSKSALTATSRRNVIGVIVGEFNNPVFTTMVDELSIELGRRGYLTSVAVTDAGFATTSRCLASLEESSVDGVVFIGGTHAEVEGGTDDYQRLLDEEFPFVLVGGDRVDVPAPHILCDEMRAGMMGTRHLLELGHTRIGCILGPERFIATQRFIRGFERTMAEHGLDAAGDSIAHVPFTLEGGRAGATRLIDRGYTAAICGNDLMALGAVRAAETMGVPFSAIGYDGTDMTALTQPPLTTLRQPFTEMMSLIADAVVGEVERPGSFADSFVFEPTLVVRDSTHSVADATFDEAALNTAG